MRGPIAKGVLSGKFTADSRFDDSVRASWNDGKDRDTFLARVRNVEQVRFLEAPDRTMAQAALQWVLANPAVTCAIPGAKNVAQITANAAAADGSLSADELGRVRETAAAW